MSIYDYLDGRVIEDSKGSGFYNITTTINKKIILTSVTDEKVSIATDIRNFIRVLDENDDIKELLEHRYQEYFI